jgi:5'-phosphate synthase pdxT subunit
MADEPWFEALRAVHAGGGAILGTCAGAILLAQSVSPAQPSLGLLEADVARNGYGRQLESFEARLDAPGFDGTLLGVFIRAPRFTALGPGVEVLARLDGEPVLVRQGRVLAATFHPEIARDDRVHRLLLAA